LCVGAVGPAIAADRLTVVSGAVTAGLNDVVELVAEGAGFYKDQNLDVERQYSGGGSNALQLVASGKGDIASVSVEPVLQAYEKGLRVQFFLTRLTRYQYVLAVPVASPIRALADFRGADIGEIAAGSPAEVVTQSMLAGAGLRKDDYAFIPVGAGPQALATLLAKRVSGLAFPSIVLVVYQVAGNTNLRIFRHPLLADIPDSGYAATPATIATKADALRRFARAIVEAALFIRKYPATAARLYLQTSGQKVTPEALAATTRELLLMQDDLPAANPANPRIGELPARDVTFLSAFLVEAGMARRIAPASELVTDRFIRYANDIDRADLARRARQLAAP